MVPFGTPSLTVSSGRARTGARSRIPVLVRRRPFRERGSGQERRPLRSAPRPSAAGAAGCGCALRRWSRGAPLRRRSLGARRAGKSRHACCGQQYALGGGNETVRMANDLGFARAPQPAPVFTMKFDPGWLCPPRTPVRHFSRGPRVRGFAVRKILTAAQGCVIDRGPATLRRRSHRRWVGMRRTAMPAKPQTATPATPVWFDSCHGGSGSIAALFPSVRRSRVRSRPSVAFASGIRSAKGADMRTCCW